MLTYRVIALCVASRGKNHFVVSNFNYNLTW